jgi:hypothetical protein
MANQPFFSVKKPLTHVNGFLLPKLNLCYELKIHG